MSTHLPEDADSAAATATGNDESVPQWTRRLFRYGDHTIEDPGPAFSIEEVRQGLVPYFEDLVSATHREEVRPDGTLVVTFQKRTTHKGGGILAIGTALCALPPDPLSGAAHQTVPPSLRTLGDVLAHAELLLSLSEEQEAAEEALPAAIRRCEALQPVPLLACLPLGF